MPDIADRKTSTELVGELARELRDAAHRLAMDGQPQVGATYLRYALAMLPQELGREILVDLAALESRYDMPTAVAHLDSLLTGTENPTLLAEAASALLAMNPSMRNEHARRIALDTVTACEDPDTRLKLLARIAVSEVLALGITNDCERIVAEMHGSGTVTGSEKAALGVIAFVDLWRGYPLSAVQARAEALFRDDWAASLQEHDAAYGLGMTALVLTDSPLIPEAIDEAVACARRLSASGYTGGVLALRARARLRVGDLAGAAADGRAAFEGYSAYGGGCVPLAYALAVVLDAEVARGNMDAATEALARSPSDAQAGTLGLAGIQLARARLRAAAGAPEVAFDELMRIGAEYESLGGGSPALLPWRSEAALLAKRLGRDEQALALAESEVADAAYAGPRALGRALTTRAVVAPPADGDARSIAAEAVRQLDRVPAPLDLARALLIGGRLTADGSAPEQSRQTFARALDLAERSGARPLAQAARKELVRVGGRPRRGASVGVEGLTAAERAIAHAAATGRSNREIAESMHLAPGTVKNHLASVYRKLSVGSRSQLSDALHRKPGMSAKSP